MAVGVGLLAILLLYRKISSVAKLMVILWTAFASVFALLFGYSRIPFAAARDGFFFSVFARLHPRAEFPHVSLLTLGAVVLGASFFTLDGVIKALMTTRLLVQFIAQIFAVHFLRKVARTHSPSRSLRFQMALYPLPSLVAFCGWTYIFITSGMRYMLGGLASLGLGIVAFLVWSHIHSASKPRNVSQRTGGDSRAVRTSIRF